MSFTCNMLLTKFQLNALVVNKHLLPLIGMVMLIFFQSMKKKQTEFPDSVIWCIKLTSKYVGC